MTQSSRSGQPERPSISLNTLNRADPSLPSSFRDPSGFLFHRGGVLYRQINRFYAADYDLLMSTGLYARLVKDRLLIPHQEVDEAPAIAENAYRVIRPEPLTFISYPYEWSFSQLKDAALTTLEIEKQALACGLWLKDSSAYNIQFHHGRPVLIDSLSFERYPEGHPWTAYRQFCQHFLAPLGLVAYRDVRLMQMLRLHLDGLPLDLASSLLPRRTWLRLPLLFHLHLHATGQRKYAGQSVASASAAMPKPNLLALIDNLQAAVRGLRWQPQGSWSDYYEFHNYSEVGLEQKKQLVVACLERLQPTNVWDLGANTGLFSRLASARGIPTVAFDIDPGAVELNYRQCVTDKETNLLPLLLDLTNPSPAIGWALEERMSLLERAPADLVLALALVHHMAISNNVPLARLAEFLARCGRRLIIEFVPKSDPQVQKLLIARQDIFSEYTEDGFQHAFRRYFNILQIETIGDSGRSLYIMEKLV